MTEKIFSMTAKERICGFILAVPMVLLAVWGFFVFTVFLKCTPIQWLMYNVCAPTEIAFFLLFLFSKNSPARLYIAALPLLYFGTMGLFIFPWSGQGAIISQISHILMTLSVMYIIYINRAQRISASIIYWIYAVALLIAVQQRYCFVTSDVVKKMLNI